MTDPSIIDTVYVDPEDKQTAENSSWDDNPTYKLFITPPWNETMHAKLYESVHSPQNSRIVSFHPNMGSLGDASIDHKNTDYYRRSMRMPVSLGTG